MTVTEDRVLSKLRKVSLSDLEPTSIMEPLVTEAPHANIGSDVVDADGQRVFWPWQSDAVEPPQQSAVQRYTSTRLIRARHRLDDLIDLALAHATADRKGGVEHTGVRAWYSFCEDIMGVPADRPMDPLTTPLWEKLEDEWLAMRFVCALVQDRGISPSSAYQYFSAVQGWHSRKHGVKLCGGLKLERLPQMLKGLKRITGEAPRAVRRGISPKKLKLGMDMLLSRDDPAHANIRAALSVAFSGLLRSAEFSEKGGKLQNSTIRRSDINSLDALKLVLMMSPCKNMHHLSGRTCPLVLGAGGSFVDAVEEVHNLLRVDPIQPGMAESTPMFRDPLTNSPLSYEVILAIIKRIIVAVGDDPDQYGTHSLRIGGATALFAAGANETVIRTMGRWSSDIHRLYVRACFEQCCDWTKRAASVEVSDLAGEFDEVDSY